jgi:hypothetical protein
VHLLAVVGSPLSPQPSPAPHGITCPLMPGAPLPRPRHAPHRRGGEDSRCITERQHRLVPVKAPRAPAAQWLGVSDPGRVRGRVCSSRLRSPPPSRTHAGKGTANSHSTWYIKWGQTSSAYAGRPPSVRCCCHYEVALRIHLRSWRTRASQPQRWEDWPAPQPLRLDTAPCFVHQCTLSRLLTGVGGRE